MRGAHARSWLGRRADKQENNVDRVDRVLAIAADDQRYRWASAMIRTWKVGDVVVGVTKGRDISLLTVRDSTTVEDPIALARAIRSATAFARFRAPIAR